MHVPTLWAPGYHRAVTLHPDAQTLLDAATALRLPRIETLDPEAARSLFDARSAAVDVPAVASVTDHAISGPAGDITVRIYRPIASTRPAPAIVFFHGGGWVIGSIDTHDSVCRSLANEVAGVVFSVDYRLAPEHPYPAAVEDSIAATRWVLEHASELDVDAHRVSVCGDSAGGNLAAAVCHALGQESSALRAQILVYPVTDLTEHETESMRLYGDDLLLTNDGIEWFIEHYVPDADRRNEPLCSPGLADPFGSPPTLVLIAECDPLATDGERFAAKLREAGVLTEFVVFDGMVHSFFTQIGVIGEAQRAVERIAAFLRSLD